jgi:hypothetical protein
MLNSRRIITLPAWFSLYGRARQYLYWVSQGVCSPFTKTLLHALITEALPRSWNLRSSFPLSPWPL